ncbi:MAG TPA: hypothetical protein VNE67_13905 [Acetobacteraceae bacterium]|nr:hypothetical protein [Acetobacteraceae bacterium]
MSSISAVSSGIAMHAPPPAANKSSKPDGDGDHGVEPSSTAKAQSSAGSAGSSGAVNLTA